MICIEDLSVDFGRPGAPRLALRDVSLSLDPGARVGVVGESGSGKSMLGLSMIGMLPEAGKLSATGLEVTGQDMRSASASHWRSLRARKVAMIFQEPMVALNPLRRVGETVMEPLRSRLGLSRAEARARALHLFEEVELSRPAARLRLYPHELSGGQRQRVLIALALACDPALLIADEPTTALDAQVEARVIDLLVRLSQQRGMGLIFISHDLAAVARATEDLVVLYGGEIVERGPTARLLRAPSHPYTRGLIAARPNMADALAPRPAGAPRLRLPVIPGTVPPLKELPEGCRFAGRCPVEMPHCATIRPQSWPTAEGEAACHRLAPDAPPMPSGLWQPEPVPGEVTP